MADHDELIELINAYIKRNGRQAITGQVLNGVLRAMVEDLGNVDPIVVDSEMSETSENPVQNKVITEALRAVDKVFWAEYGVTTYQDIVNANTAGKVCFAIRQSDTKVYALGDLQAASARFYIQQGQYNYELRCNSNDTWQTAYSAALRSADKVDTIVGNETATNKIPSTRAVYDALPKDVVQYVAQTLTEAQKQQARSNIGATAPEVFWATYGTTTAAEIDAAVAAGKAVMCAYSNRIYYLSFYDPTSSVIYFGSIYEGISQRIMCRRSNNNWEAGLFTLERQSNKAQTIEGNETNTNKYPSTKAVADALGKMGVVSQTQTWTGSNAAGWDYTMSNIVRGIIPQSFIDMATAHTGLVFNDSTGYFELNGLTDISYQEMATILSYGMCPKPDGVGYPLTGWGGRTTLPYISSITLGALGRYSMGSGCRGASCEIIVFARMGQTLENTIYISAAMNYGFQSCPHLKTIIGELYPAASAQNFDNCFNQAYSLENIKLRGLNANCSFNHSSRLSLASVVFMVDNAVNTSAITITLHATAYARCQADTTEYTYNGQTYTGIIAYASAKNISIVSA